MGWWEEDHWGKQGRRGGHCGMEGMWGGNANQISIRREMLEMPWKHTDRRPAMLPTKRPVGCVCVLLCFIELMVRESLARCDSERLGL